MHEPNTMRVKTLVFVCLVFLAALASHARAASGADSVRFRKLPPITRDIEDLPRLVAGAKPVIVRRINNILARRDAWVRSEALDCLHAKDGDWARQAPRQSLSSSDGAQATRWGAKSDGNIGRCS